jgi:hypothetical protein
MPKLRTPQAIKRFMTKEIAYDHVWGTCRSPIRSVRDRKANCMEGALLAAASLQAIGFRPLIVSLSAVRDDDHVIAVYQVEGCWGAIAQSAYAGLKHRDPVFRTLRELVMSYFEFHINAKGEKTLRKYSRPVDLGRFDDLDWVNTDVELWAIPDYLNEIAHIPVMPESLGRHLIFGAAGGAWKEHAT